MQDPSIVLVGVGCLIAIAALMRSRPRFGMVLWLLCIAFVPVWMGVTIKFYFMPATLLGLLLLVVVAHRTPVRFGPADLLIGIFMLSCLAPLITGGSTWTTVFVLLTNWLVPFLLGRLLPPLVGLDWLYGALAVIFSLVSLGLLIEYFTNYNPFVRLMARGNSLYGTWGTIQLRGGKSRSEGAFGHSIAAGSAVAMTMPLALASRFRTGVRIVLVLLMGGGIVVTFSRISMVAAGLGVALTVFLLRGLSLRFRVVLIVAGAALAGLLAPFVSETLQTAGSEASDSASYRGSLIDLVSHIAVLGFSPIATRASDGSLYFGNFQSIDSQLIYTGLQYGWFALIVGVLGLLAVIATVLMRRASAATIALAAQIPALATVALITQYGDFFWFMVGVAAFSQGALRYSAEASRPTTTASFKEPVARQAKIAVQGQNRLGDSPRRVTLRPVRFDPIRK